MSFGGDDSVQLSKAYNSGECAATEAEAAKSSENPPSYGTNVEDKPSLVKHPGPLSTQPRKPAAPHLDPAQIAMPKEPAAVKISVDKHLFWAEKIRRLDHEACRAA
jgi:hypothetical protein